MPGIPDACLVFLLAHACNVDLACCDMLCVARNSADVSQARGARVHQSNAERSERNLFPGLYLTCLSNCPNSFQRQIEEAATKAADIYPMVAPSEASVKGLDSRRYSRSLFSGFVPWPAP